MNPGRIWRIFASGLAFTLFGLLGILLSLLILPPLYLLPLSRNRRTLAGRKIVRLAFGTLVRALCLLRLMRLRITGLEHYPEDRPVIVAPNHPTYIDVAVLLGWLPNLVCIVKTGVWNNPCMGPAVRTAGFIPNRDAEQFLADASRRIEEGRSILIFPEGSRSFRDRMRPFQRGTAQLALRTGTPILPVRITCTPPSMYKGCRWYQVADRTCDVVLNIEPPVDIVPWIGQEKNLPLAARSLTSFLEEDFRQALHAYYEEL